MLLLAIELFRWRVALRSRFEREPLDVLLRSISTQTADGACDTAALLASIERAERWIDRVPWLAQTCLYRSLARFAALRSRGVAAVFVMGLPEGGGDGHAWIEIDGASVLEDDERSPMTVTFCYPPSARTPAGGAQRSY